MTSWKNAVIVPIPKKGDLRICDNWRAGFYLGNIFWGQAYLIEGVTRTPHNF